MAEQDAQESASAAEVGKAGVKKATSFWTKISEDWSLNFSGMLAYNYLTAIAPILLAVIAIAGLALGSISPSTYQSFIQGLSTHLPASVGQELVDNALKALRKSAGILLVIAIVAAIFSGSRLFVALDNVFAVIYRVDVRPLVKQNIMAVLMMLLFLLLAPLTFFASSLPATVLALVLPSGVQRSGVVLTTEGFVGGVIVAFILFAAIYYVVPNRRMSWSTTWPGALVTAVLLNLYEALFPIYQSVFLKNAGLGSVVGLAVVILIFLYYIGVITLLGAEINSWVSGLRPLGATLPQLFQRERLEGVGHEPGSPAAERSDTPPTPSGAGGRVESERGATRQPEGQRVYPAGASPATRAGGKAEPVTSRFASLGARFATGAGQLRRRLSRPPQPST